jgi:3D (Asp-Asp-Asp) domain-containing protein
MKHLDRRSAGLAALCLIPVLVSAAPGARHGALTLKPGRDTTSNDYMNVGDSYTETITTSCYDVNGNPLDDSVTLTVTGQPDTGGATTTFTPNPQQTFSAGAAFLVTTTKKTDAKAYSMVLTGTGPVCGQYGTLTLPLTVYPVLSMSRTDLVTVESTGKPVNGGTFAYESATAAGSVIAPIAMSAGDTATTNPNHATLTDPPNPSGSGAPNAGGLGKYTVKYTVAGLTATNDKSNPFQVPVFGMSCYYTALESDWGTPPNACRKVRIHGTTYTGTVTDPNGLTGTFCSSFIAEVKLQGSAVRNDGTDIQYDPGTDLITTVASITGADGTPVVAGQTVARARSIIPGRGVHVDVHGVGTSLLANDTGNAIQGYRLDFYQGAGEGVCANYANPMGVSACTPKTINCPGSALK